MGRAQNNQQAVAVGGFDGLLGARRGGPQSGLGCADPTPDAQALARRLGRQANEGDLTEALAEFVRAAGRSTPESLNSPPLLVGLADDISQGAAHAGTVGAEQYEEFMDRLGLDRSPPVDHPPALGVSLVAAHAALHQAARTGNPDPAPLLAAAREPHLDAFCEGLVRRVRRAPTDEVMHLYDADEISTLVAVSQAPEFCGDTVSSARYLASLLSDADWRESVRDCLRPDGAALCDLLRTRLVINGAASANFDD